jgi:hypothetical protein
MPKRQRIISFALIVYLIGALATFGKLTFFDGIAYNWWNWIILVPLIEGLALIWPVYWLFVRWLFH